MLKCPYCGSNAELKDSKIIYGVDYGMMYICSNFPKCDSYVGTHKKGLKPLGTLANKELREKRNQTHKLFDGLWQRKLKLTADKKARKKAYKWLSQQLGIEVKDTHIALFDIDMCNRVMSLCRPYYKNLKG